MRILLTGATGQLGGALRVALADLGELHVPARTDLDLADAGAIAAAVRSLHPHLIVNAGAYTAVDRAESEPKAAMAVNGIAPGLLAAEAGKCGAAVVHYSTDYVFDGHKPSAYVEDDPPAPLNVYGASKLAGEQAVLSAGAPHLVLRTAWVYASRGGTFLQAVLERAHRGERIEVVDDQFGAPTSASAVAEATARLVRHFCPDGRMERDWLQACSGIYHMTAAGRTNRYEFAIEILRQSGIDLEVHPVASASRGDAAKRPRNSVLDNTRLRQRFGIALPHWQEGLRVTLNERGRDSP